MDPETLEALKGSIAKWERVVEGGQQENGGPTDCPLCSRFNSQFNKNLTNPPCQGCPVSIRTGQKFCEGSPYDEIEKLEDGGEYVFDSNEEFVSTFRSAAKEELEFLKSLLPRQST
jgi:hypothetical protein